MRPNILYASAGLAAVLVAGCRAHTEPVIARDLAGHELQLSTIEKRSTARGLVFTIPEVLFEIGKADLKIDAKRELTAIAAALREHPNQKVVIEGHTDSTGSSAYNHELSLRRGTVVETFFLKLGIDPERIEVRGLGEHQPVASNATAAGRQQNRRVEIVMPNTERLTVSAAPPSPPAPEGARSTR